MAQGDGRRRGRESRADPRSRERARRTRRHPRASRLTDPRTESDEHLRDRESTAEAGEVSASERVRRARRPARSTSRRGAFATGLAVRLRGLDARRAVILALVVSVVALTLAMPLRTYFSQRAEFNQITASNEQLRREVADYQQKVNEQNDPAYIEARARERLRFLKPGEIGLVMMYPGDEAKRKAAEQAQERARAPWYGNLWESVSTPPGAR